MAGPVTDTYLDNVLEETAAIIAERTLAELTVAGTIKMALGQPPNTAIMKMPYPQRRILMEVWTLLETAVQTWCRRPVTLSDWLHIAEPGRSSGDVLQLIDYVRTGRPPSFSS
ncbi:MAG: hypothetical protein ABW022_08635 [Actinoplanes sp.]